MHRTWVIVADARRARLFSHSRSGNREHFVEHIDLFHARSEELAREVVAAFVDLADNTHPQRIVLCANATTLATLRAELAAARSTVPRIEIERDLVDRTPKEVRAYLLAAEHLPSNNRMFELTAAMK